MQRMTRKVYAILEGSRVLRMSFDKTELVRYRDSFPAEVRRGLVLAEKQGSGAFAVSRERG